MLDRVYAIALNTFREAIRAKVLYAIMIIVVAWNLFALVLGAMSLGEETRIARDVGLAGVSLFGSITAVVLGVMLLYNEIQRRTIHNILSKPIHRHEFVVGKYLGMACTLALLVAFFSLAMAGILAIQGVPWSAAVGKAVILHVMEVMIVAAIAVFFSSFSSPFLSGVFSFGLFFIGRLSDALRTYAEQAKETWMRVLCEAGLLIAPDLHIYSISGGEVDGAYVSVHGQFVDWGYVATAGAYALLYVVALLALAIVIFHRRDFT